MSKDEAPKSIRGGQGESQKKEDRKLPDLKDVLRQEVYDNIMNLRKKHADLLEAVASSPGPPIPERERAPEPAAASATKREPTSPGASVDDARVAALVGETPPRDGSNVPDSPAGNGDAINTSTDSTHAYSRKVKQNLRNLHERHERGMTSPGVQTPASRSSAAGSPSHLVRRLSNASQTSQHSLTIDTPVDSPVRANRTQSDISTTGYQHPDEISDRNPRFGRIARVESPSPSRSPAPEYSPEKALRPPLQPTLHDRWEEDVDAGQLLSVRNHILLLLSHATEQRRQDTALRSTLRYVETLEPRFVQEAIRTLLVDFSKGPLFQRRTRIQALTHIARLQGHKLREMVHVFISDIIRGCSFATDIHVRDDLCDLMDMVAVHCFIEPHASREMVDSLLEPLIHCIDSSMTVPAQSLACRMLGNVIKLSRPAVGAMPSTLTNEIVVDLLIRFLRVLGNGTLYFPEMFDPVCGCLLYLGADVSHVALNDIVFHTIQAMKNSANVRVQVAAAQAFEIMTQSVLADEHDHLQSPLLPFKSLALKEFGRMRYHRNGTLRKLAIKLYTCVRNVGLPGTPSGGPGRERRELFPTENGTSRPKRKTGTAASSKSKADKLRQQITKHYMAKEASMIAELRSQHEKAIAELQNDLRKNIAAVKAETRRAIDKELEMRSK